MFNFSLAGEYRINSKYEAVAEFLNVTSSGYNLGDTAAATGGTAEISGGETVGMIGGRYHINPNCFLALGITYDNNNAILFRPGFTYVFK